MTFRLHGTRGWLMEAREQEQTAAERVRARLRRGREEAKPLAVLVALCGPYGRPDR